MARTLELDTITEPSNSGTANITLSSDTTTTMPLVDINGGAIDSTTLGAGTPSSVAATTLSTTGNATVGGTLGVTGVTTLSGTTTMSGATTMSAATVTGATTLNGNVTLGNASSDTVTVTGTMAGIDNKSGMTGEMRMWSGTSSPTGWLLCDGASVSRSTYAALYAITGDAFGTASGSTFNVPDMRGRMPVGVGTGLGGAAEDADGGTVPVGGDTLEARSLGEWSGAEKLTEAQLAAHTHTGASHLHSGASHTHTTASVATTGGDHTHLGAPKIAAGDPALNVIFGSSLYEHSGPGSGMSGGGGSGNAARGPTSTVQAYTSGTYTVPAQTTSVAIRF